MNVQRTLIRYTSDTKTYDDRCAETHEVFQIEVTSEFSEKKAVPAKLARKEKKSVRRKNSKIRSKVKTQKFRKWLQKFWKLCSTNRKVLLVVIICVLCLNPSIQEFLLDEKVIKLLGLVLGP